MEAVIHPREAQRSAPAPAVHVLIFPFPAQGHVTSMLKLAELLSLAGLHVTFLSSDYNHHRLRRFSGSYARLAQRPTFRFLSIPDGLADERPRSASRLLELMESLSTRSVDLFRELLIACRTPGSDGWPPVTCVVADGIMPLMVDVAEGLGIPAIAFRTSSCCSFWAYLHIPNLIHSGEIPLPDEADLDELVKNVPGMESVLRRRDLPSFIRRARDITDPILQFVATVTADTSRARGLIFNTLEFMEGPLLERIRSRFPTTYALGPLHTLLGAYASCSPTYQQGGELGIAPTFSISASMWQEDRACVTWLDSQPRRSVVYVSFGSFTVMSREVLLEFWHGLLNSGHRFLWVARPGLVGDGDGNEEIMTLSPPEELVEETRKRGCLVGWAPQEEVLSHPAVGCFLTHSGWNSTLESITAGVPMICWPFIADQQINSRLVSAVWGVGVDMKDMCERGIVERMVRKAMEGESAEELRRSAGVAAEMARRSVEEGGTSFLDFLRLVHDIKSFSCPDGARVS